MLVHQFWFKGELDIVGKLSAESIAIRDYELMIWGYNIEQFNPNYAGHMYDAEDILPRNEIPKCAECPHFGRQYEIIVSELFRYKVLYELGGWWLDNDIIVTGHLTPPNPLAVRSIYGTAYPNAMYVNSSEQQIMVDCYANLNLTKWNKTINEQIIAHRIKNWQIPTEWFGLECEFRYFEDNRVVYPPEMGIHLCRGWLKKQKLLERTNNSYFNQLRKQYRV